MATEHQFYCAGEWRSSSHTVTIRNPYSGDVVGTTSLASHDDLDDAINAAVRAFEETRRLQSYCSVKARSMGRDA